MHSIATENDTHSSLPGDTTFNQVWGNEMQREDFLALAAGLRQFSVLHSSEMYMAPPAMAAGASGVLAQE